MKNQSFITGLALVLLTVVTRGRVTAEVNEQDFDASWAIHTDQVSTHFGEQQRRLYDNFMEGCRNTTESEAEELCDGCESFRLKMNRLQPMSTWNYTSTGFKKIKAPPKLFKLLSNFWEKNRESQIIEWKTINTYHNMWDAPPSFVSVTNRSLVGGGDNLKQEIWDAARTVLEEWTGQYLVPTSLWGIRTYPNGSILAPHVDRGPLVVSAIINVDQDVREPWPLEVFGHDGIPHNITMMPGEMVLYESHSVLHGRPFPLQGNFFANIFIHFEVVGPIPKHGNDLLPFEDNVLESIKTGLSPYLIRGSEWEEQWREFNPDGWSLLQNLVTKTDSVHKLVGKEDFDIRLLYLVGSIYPSRLHTGDENGWQPIHEAARAGNKDAVEFLLQQGANVNERTNYGSGMSPLALAVEFHGKDHKLSQLLQDHGAIEYKYGDEL